MISHLGPDPRHFVMGENSHGREVPEYVAGEDLMAHSGVMMIQCIFPIRHKITKDGYGTNLRPRGPQILVY